MNNILPPDYHLHTCYSDDCKTPIDDLIQSAINNGLKSICITDHHDPDFPVEKYNIGFGLDLENYFKDIPALRDKYLPEIDVRCGIELGVMPSTCEKLAHFSKEHPELDFIICSTHVVDNIDPYYPEYFHNEDGSQKDLLTQYRRYLEEILYTVQNFNDYNVYGHLDYIFRYGPDKVTEESFRDTYFSPLKDIITEILKTIIDNGKGIEINTGSLYRGMDYAHPHPEILKLYKELGGEILTFGSDAHDNIHAGFEFKKARDLALALGFKYRTEFSKLQPEYITL